MWVTVERDASWSVDMKGFRKFLLRGNLIDLAVAVVVGVAFNNIVQALITDLITPLIGAITGTKNGKPKEFASYTFTLHGSKFTYGHFLNAIIAFLVIAAVVYFLLVAPSQKLAALAARNQAATDRQCPECLSLIPMAAKRCKYCTSEVPPAPVAEPPAGPILPVLRLGRHRSAEPETPAAPELQ
jgi:large conductance mechanosensitive channel